MTTDAQTAARAAQPPAPQPPRAWRHRLVWLRDGLWATLPAWAAAHVLVGGTSWWLNPHHPLAALFGWDTQWYLAIAQHGYDAGGGLIHFFPLTSLAVAGLAAITRLPNSIALFGFCWAAALVFGALVHRLTLRETGDRGAARRAAWLTQLVPGAYALVMGYTEPLAGVLAVAYFLAVRGRRNSTTRLAVVCGFLSGMARPVGVLLAIPGTVEGLRSARRDGWTRAAAIALAPITGLAVFLGYSRVRYGSWLLPYTQQTAKLGRGGVMNDPIAVAQRVWTHNWRNHGHGATVMALVLIACFAALLALMLITKRLPIAYLAWTLPSFVLAIGSKDFTSLPRYLGALFPCLMALAVATRRRWQWAAVLAVSCGLLLWTTYFVFAGYIVA